MSTNPYSLRKKSKQSYKEYSLDLQTESKPPHGLPYLYFNSGELVVNHYSIMKVYFPQYHKEDNKWWVFLVVYNAEPYYKLFKDAVLEFHETDKTISYCTFIENNRNNKYMTNSLWEYYQEITTVTIKPKHPIGTLFVFNKYNNEIHILQYGVIYDYNEIVQCHINNVDDHLMYKVAHVNPMNDQFIKFTKKEGKKYNLTNPKGLVKESDITPIASKFEKNGWSALCCHYYKLEFEKQIIQNQNITNAFTGSITHLFNCIGGSIRSQLHRRNEGKVLSKTYIVPNQFMDVVIHKKFIKIQKNHKFVRKGNSVYYWFNHQNSTEIFSDSNINRDFNEDGREVFPNIDDEVDYTMSTTGCLVRYHRPSLKLYRTINIVRIDSEGNMFGQNKEWMQTRKNFI